MALRVKCKCGKSLKISSQFAGRKLACPACKHPFRISAEKFRAAEAAQSSASTPLATTSHAAGGGAARAARAAESPSAQGPARGAPSAHGRARVAPAAVPVPDPMPASLDEELLAGLGAADVSFSRSDVLAGIPVSGAAAGAAPMAIDLGEGAPAADVTYARDRTVALPGLRTKLDARQGPSRGFWTDAFYSFIYPVKPAGNAVTLVFILAAAALDTYFAMMFPFVRFGLFSILIKLSVRLMLFGWLASVYLSIVGETARGSDDLPGLNLEDGLMDGVLKPAFKFIGAFAVAFLPAIVLLISIATGLASETLAVLIPVWLLIGIFFIPLILLLFSLDSLSMILRLDLMVTTIIKSFLPYLAIWLMLLVVGFGMIAAKTGGVVLRLVLPDFLVSPSAAIAAGGLAVQIGVSLISTYLMLVSMRIVGLYYLHFKRRFTMELE